MTMTTTDAPQVRRWDAVVRVTHWSIVAAILADAVFTDAEIGRAHV